MGAPIPLVIVGVWVSGVRAACLIPIPTNEIAPLKRCRNNIGSPYSAGAPLLFLVTAIVYRNFPRLAARSFVGDRPALFLGFVSYATSDPIDRRACIFFVAHGFTAGVFLRGARFFFIVVFLVVFASISASFSSVAFCTSFCTFGI